MSVINMSTFISTWIGLNKTNNIPPNICAIICYEYYKHNPLVSIHITLQEYLEYSYSRSIFVNDKIFIINYTMDVIQTCACGNQMIQKIHLVHYYNIYKCLNCKRYTKDTRECVNYDGEYY